jgi:cell division control protein 6
MILPDRYNYFFPYFSIYDALQLRDILQLRAKTAFKPGVLTEEALQLCAAFAAQ